MPHCSTRNMAADIFTKASPLSKFTFHRAQLRILPNSSTQAGEEATAGLHLAAASGISRSLWDEFISSDAESQSIFLSTSAIENTYSDPALHSFDSLLIAKIVQVTSLRS